MNLMSALIAADMLRFGNIYSDRNPGSNYRARRIHGTKKGPGRSVGMKLKPKSAGRKFAKKAFEGMVGLRNGIGAAGRIAQQGNWGG